MRWGLFLVLGDLDDGHGAAVGLGDAGGEDFIGGLVFFVLGVGTVAALGRKTIEIAGFKLRGLLQKS